MKHALAIACKNIIIRLEPTYKELKQNIEKAFVVLQSRLEPTYKELKLSYVEHGLSIIPRLEPTYKELKLGRREIEFKIDFLIRAYL